MRLTFCFSRSCSPYPVTFVRRVSRPCWPGGVAPRFSIAQDGLKHRSPFRKSFAPSRRHSRHFASLYLAKVHSPEKFTGGRPCAAPFVLLLARPLGRARCPLSVLRSEKRTTDNGRRTT